MKAVRRYRCKGHDEWVWAVGTEEKCLRLLSELGIPKSQTYFADSKIPMTVWFAALWDMAATRGKVTAVELSTRYGVEIKAAQRLAKKLRKEIYGGRTKKGFNFRISEDVLVGWFNDGWQPFRRLTVPRQFPPSPSSTSPNLLRPLPPPASTKSEPTPNKYPPKVVAFATAVVNDPELNQLLPKDLTANVKLLLQYVAKGEFFDPTLAELIIQELEEFVRHERHDEVSEQRKSSARLAIILRTRIMPAVARANCPSKCQ